MMYRMHVDQTGVWIAAEAVDIRFETMGQNMVVPGGVACLAAEDQDEGWIKQLESFGPLVCFSCVVFFCHLFNLPMIGQTAGREMARETKMNSPWSPAFITKRPSTKRERLLAPFLETQFVARVGTMRIHLPVLNTIWFIPSMLSPEIGVVSILSRIAILDPSQCYWFDQDLP